MDTNVLEKSAASVFMVEGGDNGFFEMSVPFQRTIILVKVSCSSVQHVEKIHLVQR
jgi:hypothetical protein